MLFVVAAAAMLASCSGQKNHICTTNCGGDATVSVTLFDTPPAGVSLLSFSLPIVGISLTPSTGSDVSIYSPATIIPTELTRLQTDSAAIATGVSVVAGTYTSINITVAASSGMFINDSGSMVGSCAAGLVCGLPGGAATTVKVPISLTLTSGQTQWIGLDVNLNNAIVTTGGIGIDFTQPNVFTATTTTRTGIPSGGVDTIEDFTGLATAVSGTSITVKSSITGQSITATINSSTQLDAAPPAYTNCGGAASVCLVTNSVVSLDALLSSSGTYTATEIDVLDSAATDEVEGVIYPTSTAGVFGLILSDKTAASSSVLAASTTTYGTVVSLNVSGASIDGVDTKTLTPALTSPTGFSGSGDLLAGQVVRAHVTGVASGTNSVTATASHIILRFSQVSASVNSVASSSFTMTGIPAYISSFNTTLSPTPLVQTYSSATLFDGITSTTDSNFSTGKSVAIRALFMNNSATPFQAAKVRVP